MEERSRMKMAHFFKTTMPAAACALALLTPAAWAQRSAAARGRRKQHSELSVQVTGVFTRSTSVANAVNPFSVNKHIATNSAGILVGYRYHFNSWEALEAEYGY